MVEERFLDVLREVEPRLGYLRRIVHFRSPDFAGASHPGRFSRIELVLLASLPSEPPDLQGEPTVSTIASIIFTSGTSGPAKGVMMPHARASALALQTVQGLRLAERDTFYALTGCSILLESVRESGAAATLAHGAMLDLVYAEPARADDADNPLELRRAWWGGLGHDRGEQPVLVPARRAAARRQLRQTQPRVGRRPDGRS